MKFIVDSNIVFSLIVSGRVYRTWNDLVKLRKLWVYSFLISGSIFSANSSSGLILQASGK